MVIQEFNLHCMHVEFRAILSIETLLYSNLQRFYIFLTLMYVGSKDSCQNHLFCFVFFILTEARCIATLEHESSEILWCTCEELAFNSHFSYDARSAGCLFCQNYPGPAPGLNCKPTIVSIIRLNVQRGVAMDNPTDSGVCLYLSTIYMLFLPCLSAFFS